MSDDQQANEVRRRMSELRADLDYNVHQVSENARALADWKYYPRRFPWATMALTAAAGYLVVPKRALAQSANGEVPGSEARQKRFSAARKEKANFTEGLASYLVSILAAGIMRAGTAYLKESLSGKISHGNPTNQSARAAVES